jgi:HSP20 family protein
MARNDYFGMLDRIRSTFDDFGMSDLFGPLFAESSPGQSWGLYEGDWSPRLDLFEDEDNYFVKVDLPGMEAGDIDLSVTNDVLTIKGERKIDRGSDREKRGGKYAREERLHGTFQRTVPLPMPVNGDMVKAQMKDGVLYITLPKREETKPRKITVKVS